MPTLPTDYTSASPNPAAAMNQTNAAVNAKVDTSDVMVNVKDYGAVGDGSTDDTAALQSALASGQSLNWGGAGNTYRITGALSTTLVRDTVWVADGAKIVLNSASPIQRVVTVTHGGYTLNVRGLRLDANSKAYTGIYCTNTGALTDLTLDGLTVENVYRGGTTFTGGDGIYIQGSFNHVKLIRPTVRNVTMASGAGTAGVQGVSGITVKSASTTAYFRKLTIDSPLIDGVYSEDSTYLADQDGIRIMNAEDDPSITVPYDASFSIISPTFINCMGRAMKSQTELGYVTNFTVIRDRAQTGQAGFDFDFQVGCGQIRGGYAKYTNGSPLAVVGLSDPVQAGKIVPHPTVTGIRVITATGTQALDSVVQASHRTDLITRHIIDDIETVGVQPTCLVAVNGIDGGTHDIIASRLIGAPSLGMLSARVVNWSGTWFIRDCICTGSAVHLVTSPTTTALPLVSAVNCKGFNSKKALDNGRFMEGPIERIEAIGTAGATKSGVIRPTANTIADGVTWKLPASFLTNYTGLLVISVDGDANGQGLFSVSQASVVTLAAGSAFTVGTTSEPGSGTYRLWSSSTGPSISNHSGSAHTVTAFMVG